MQRAKIRRYALVVLAVLAAASMFPSFGGGSSHREIPRPHKKVIVVAQPHHDVRATFGLER